MRMYDRNDGEILRPTADNEYNKSVIIASGSEEPIRTYRFASETATLRLISNSMKNCIGGDRDDDDATSWFPNVNSGDCKPIHALEFRYNAEMFRRIIAVRRICVAVRPCAVPNCAVHSLRADVK